MPSLCEEAKILVELVQSGFFWSQITENRGGRGKEKTRGAGETEETNGAGESIFKTTINLLVPIGHYSAKRLVFGG